MPSRILAVADFLTALVEPRYYKPALPKQEVLDILGKSADAGGIDASVLNVVRENYDAITAQMENQQQHTLSIYDEITREYERLVHEVYSVLGMSPEVETSLRKAA